MSAVVPIIVILWKKIVKYHGRDVNDSFSDEMDNFIFIFPFPISFP